MFVPALGLRTNLHLHVNGTGDVRIHTGTCVLQMWRRRVHYDEVDGRSTAGNLLDAGPFTRFCKEVAVHCRTPMNPREMRKHPTTMGSSVVGAVQ